MSRNNNNTGALTEIAPKPDQISNTPTTGMSIFDTGAFESLTRIAGMMARSSLVPATLCENKEGRFSAEVIAANCFLVVEQSARWGLSPFAVVGCASVVHGRLMWEGKLIAAVLEAKLGVRLTYDYSGSGDNKTVVVSGTLPDEDKPRTITGSVGAWKTKGVGSPWENPANHERQLGYRGAREWARRHAPAVILGVYTPDELDEESMINVTGGRPRVEVRDTPVDPAQGPMAGEGEEAPAPVKTRQPEEDEFEPLDPNPETIPASGRQKKDRMKRTCRFLDLSKKDADGKPFWVVTFQVGKVNADMTTFSETLAENLTHLKQGDAVRITFTQGSRAGEFQLEDFETIGEAATQGGLI